MRQTILVTGSSGYIGSHFVKYLTHIGQKVVGLDRIPSPPVVARYLADFRQDDISSSESVIDLCRQNRVNGIIHCAGSCLVGESVEKPDLYFDNNVTRGSTLLKAAGQAGVQAFVFSSSAAVYGEPERSPIPEDHPKNPINPYGASKLAFEKVLTENAKRGWAIGALRYFNAAGADPEGELGETHNPETHLIPNAIAAALGKRASFDLLGTDYPTRDGTCERDFIHVWDLADAHWKMLERLSRNREFAAYNLGTGEGHTVAEVLDEIDRQTGKLLPRTHRPRRPGDPARLVADPRKAERELAWRPKHSSLSEIVGSALRWHTAQL